MWVWTRGATARRRRGADAKALRRDRSARRHDRWANKNLAPHACPGSRSSIRTCSTPGSTRIRRCHAPRHFPPRMTASRSCSRYRCSPISLRVQAERYLDEVRRVLRPDGVLLATFFLFDKAYFPMMQDFQNALYINDTDPTNAVIFDRDWLLAALELRDLRIQEVRSPTHPGLPLGARDRARPWLGCHSRGSRATRAKAAAGANQAGAPHSLKRRRRQVAAREADVT